MINLSREARRKRRLIREGKRKIEHDVSTELIVRISRVLTNDDRDFLKLYNGANKYIVMAWTDDTQEYRTSVETGFKSQYVMFNDEFVIHLDSHTRYLYIELARGYSFRESGTSQGIVVMGRAKIRLPPPTSCGAFSGVVELVGLNSDRCIVGKGALEYSMKLRRFMVL